MSLTEQGHVDERGEASAVLLDWLMAIHGVVEDAKAEIKRSQA